MNRQRKLLTEEVERVGDGRAEGCSAMGDGGRAAVSLLPDANGTDSASFLNSILSTFLKNLASNVWVVAFFFFLIFIDDKAALDCILNGFYNLHVQTSTLCLLLDILGLK